MMSTRMSYLNHLIQLGSHPLKRARWLHYCHHCRADLSGYPPGVTLCLDCSRELVREILDELVLEGRLAAEIDEHAIARLRGERRAGDYYEAL
jgi:hypothetical protein